MLDPSYIEKLTARLTVLEAELSDPGTAANQKKYRALVAEHLNLRHVTNVAERYFRLVRERDESKAIADGDDPEMKEMGKAELARVEAELPAAEQELKIALLPPDPDDSRNTIVEVRAGTGGDEAALFAGDLYRMYTRYADRMGWTCGIIDASPSELGGYKEIIFTVEGENVFRTLRYESGGHRVQRVPATEAQGRIHTSAATVAVLPEADEEDEIIIKPDDLRVDLFRSSGAGGQKVNKTESAVRLTHLPTGLVVQCQDERSQHKNRARAMKVLTAKLLDIQRATEAAKLASDRKTQVGSGDRSERIRTYNFPQNRVTDHRINLTLYNLDRVIEGEMDVLVKALYANDIELKLQKQLGV
jgi:peptide chain release factor 1